MLAVPTTLHVFKEYREVREWMMNNFQEPEYGWPQYSDFYITVIGCVVSWITMVVMEKFTWKFFYDVCKEKDNEEIRIAKT